MFDGRRALARAAGADGRPVRLGRRPRPTSGARRTSTAWRPSPRRSATSRRARARAARRSASRPTTSRRPARSSRTARPASYLIEHGVEPKDFNSYGARRGNHEVMVRGTFANIRLRNLLVAGTRGRRDASTCPTGEQMSIYDAAHALPARGRAARRHRRQGVRLRLVARLGGEGHARCSACGRSSPRATSASTARTSSAWACCRCSFGPATRAASLGLTGRETFAIQGLDDAKAGEVQVAATPDAGGAAPLRGAAPRRDAARAGLSAPRRHPPVRAQEAAGPVGPPARVVGGLRMRRLRCAFRNPRFRQVNESLWGLDAWLSDRSTTAGPFRPMRVLYQPEAAGDY